MNEGNRRRRVDRHRPEPRRHAGYALLFAILALAVIGLLVTSSHAVAIRAQRTGDRRLLQAEALAAAEYGVEQVAASGPVAAWRSKSPGTVDSAGPWSVGRANVMVRTTRLGDTLRPIALIEGIASAGGASGRRALRSTSLTLAIASPRFGALGALTTAGAIGLGPGAIVDGTDVPPAGWNCPLPGPSLPGIATPDASTVSVGSCGPACVGGAPPVAQTAAAADTSTYVGYGELTWARLVSMARPIPLIAQPAPSLSGGTCRSVDSLNWGDPGRASPAGPCEAYFPILHAAGDLLLTGGVGQGVLLVDGSLTMSGGARFAGVVVARGTVQGTGIGGRIEGAVLTASIGGAASSYLGPLTIVHSRCAMSAVERAAERAFPIPFRSWADVYR